MNSAPVVPESAIEVALATLLPRPEQELLLAACLREGRDAADSWSEFVAAVGDARSYFENDQTGLKGLLPFVESSLTANDIDAGKTFHTYARVALVREELRDGIVTGILQELIEAFDAQGISPVLMKGTAISATAYPQPSSRHIHAIDLLIHSQDWLKARALLPQLRFQAVGEAAGAAHHQNFKHWTGLALGLHSTPFYLPYFELSAAAIAGRTRTIEVQGQPVRVMSPEDLLVHVCGHAIYARSRANLRWVCDAVWLLKRNPTLDWQRVVETAVSAGFAPALLVQLRWIDRRLYPIPRQWLEKLQSHSRAKSTGSPERFYASLLHTTQSRRQALRAFAGNWRTLFGFLGFSFLPSLRYMRWKHNTESSWRAAAHYANRPCRLALRLTHLRGIA